MIRILFWLFSFIVFIVLACSVLVPVKENELPKEEKIPIDSSDENQDIEHEDYEMQAGDMICFLKEVNDAK